MAEDIRSIPAKVRKVEGGYELFIPDDVSENTGIVEGAPVILNVVGHQLLVQELEFIERARAAEPRYSGPPQVRDPREPYDPQPNFAPKRKPKYTLTELLAKVTPENKHEYLDSGPPVGNEVL